MKNSTKAGLIGAGLFAVGAGVGYAIARVVDCIQVKRMLKAAKAEDECVCDECVCDECDCGSCDVEDATVTDETNA